MEYLGVLLFDVFALLMMALMVSGFVAMLGFMGLFWYSVLDLIREWWHS